MPVTVYTKPQCPQCELTKKLLEREGVTYRTVDIVDNPAALEKVKELGYLQAPVVVTGDETWSGFQPERIKKLAA